MNTAKTALITGGTNGMGRAVAQRFLDRGMRVMVTGQTPASLAEARAILGDDARVVRSDAGDLTEIDALSRLVTDEFGTLDVLVLNAGLAEPSPFSEMTGRGFDAAFAVNVKGPFFTAKALAPALPDGGAIVLTTSIGNIMARPTMLAYDASKAALRALTRGLAAEFLPRGVRVNAVSPGPIRTSMIARSPLPDDVKARMEQQMVEATPMRRFGRAEEIAAAVEFLAFGATFTTGAELPVDGGWSQLLS
ncbi:SDR family NAD(P)-dependent oxidoreductase [Actinoplanes sp. NPDC049265]|uniref:SDR family NAD(P)-dependent oxidoreductase n=1 Tax=Actinoplanes sp. NPDC049265 TaxID=3363902 RepID=UPI003717BC7A